MASRLTVRTRNASGSATAVVSTRAHRSQASCTTSSASPTEPSSRSATPTSRERWAANTASGALDSVLSMRILLARHHQDARRAATVTRPADMSHPGRPLRPRGTSNERNTDMPEITIIGGGLAGLTAAVACAEGGAQVVVHEAHATLGGRARTTAGAWVAHEGPHAFCADGPHWPWLVERNLVGPVVGVPLREAGRFRIHHDGRLRRTPPAALLPMLARRRRSAPVDVDFHSWASALHGVEAARAAANLLGVVTFDHDPGRLSAAFVWDLLLRQTALRAPAVRWPVGGWPAVVDRLAARARGLGVRIVTSSRVDALPEPPVIVATQLEAA